MHRENDKIERYKTYLRLEKALSANSIDAYLTDLDKLTNFVESEGKKYADVTYDDLQQFVARLHDIGIHPRSQARIISGIKSFYRFLFLDDYITTDPTELLESPKIGLKLPEVLTVNEINSILDTIDLTLPEGQRNRAMLEVLYSCGLRVSELVSLRFTDVYFDEGFIKVEGKGSKQRLVPISETAIKEIKNGKISYRNDKDGNLAINFGKASFDANKLADNLNAVIETINKIRPSSVKGAYILSATVSSTYGPAIKIAL